VWLNANLRNIKKSSLETKKRQINDFVIISLFAGPKYNNNEHFDDGHKSMMFRKVREKKSFMSYDWIIKELET
jgi:hypothetical protein